MNKRFVSACGIFIVAAMMLTQSGCWDRRELDTIAIVLGIGIDKEDASDGIDMTFQAAKTSGKSGSSSDMGKADSKSSGDSYYVNVKGTGKDVFPIIRDCTHKISRKLYFAHNQTLIFGESLAREGVRDYYDFFVRDPELRMTSYILVARGSAEEVLNAECKCENVPASEIASMMKVQKFNSETPVIIGDEFAKGLVSRTKSSIAPIVGTIEEEGKKNIYISGCAVFKGDRMVGELDKTETRGYLLIMDKVESGAMEVEVEGERAVLEIRGTEGKIKPVLKEDGTILIKIRIKEECSLASQTGTESLATPDNFRLMEQEAEKIVKKQAQGTIDKARNLGSDIFGFGEAVNKEYPKEWKTLEDEWDVVFRDITVEIDATVKLRGAGRLTQPLYPEKEQ